ncbi:hypothetical protein SCUCBS95973_009896 [Sporothrix curviconia]|uniref:Zn(2)-C6 fungal-type domain-containing protein n=1 Tax=Sporothrix curviconia TaxID=1260050 RepID=A0ABP0D1Y6_9PEZI
MDTNSTASTAVEYSNRHGHGHGHSHSNSQTFSFRPTQQQQQQQTALFDTTMLPPFASTSASASVSAASASPPPAWAANLALVPEPDNICTATTGNTSAHAGEPPCSTKRPRVALACQRCKARKQKCDGRQPCGKCRPAGTACEYVVPQKPMPFGKNQYIKSLERRVAELETLLAHRGVAEVGTDHWSAQAAMPDGAASMPMLLSSSGPAPAGHGVLGVHGRPPSAPSENHSKASSPMSGHGHGQSQSQSQHNKDTARDPDEAILDWQDGGLDSVVSVLRSLSLDVNGSGYIGASSHVALGRMFRFLDRRGSSGQSPPATAAAPGSIGGHHLNQHQQQGQCFVDNASIVRRRSSSFHRLSMGAKGNAMSMAGGGVAAVADTDAMSHTSETTAEAAAAAAAAAAVEPIDFAGVPSNVADRLYVGYIKNIMTRFPVVHSIWLRQVHHRRHGLTDVFEATILHLIYATSARFIETTGESGPYHAQRHYASAMRRLDTMLEYNDTRTIQALMLMAIYCLRDPAGPGAWTCSRMALLVAIDHGLHRQTKAVAQARSMESELRKRLFWACYCFDRQISIPMGRPLGISDRDIDIALPLDIDEDMTDAQLAVVQLPVRVAPSDPSTSLTSFVLIARLRQIESDIQETIYRVDNKSGAASIGDAVIDGFLERLERWKAQIPHDTTVVKDIPGFPYDGYYFYMVFYYKCQRLLLYPSLSDRTASPRFLRECAKACAGVCGAYKRLHQTLAVGYSFMALQNVFIAGLTLVYCIWLCPSDIFDMATSNGIHDCSIVLFVIAERVPAATKYRNAFELIRQKVIDQIVSQAPDHRQPRAALAGLTDELMPSAHAFEVNMPFEVGNGSFEQFSQIITDMSGGESFVAGLTRFHAEMEAVGGGGGGLGHGQPAPGQDQGMALCMSYESVFGLSDM